MASALSGLSWIFPTTEINGFSVDLLLYLIPVIMLVGGLFVAEKIANVIIDLLKSN